MRLKSSGSDKLKGFFLPFIMGQHYCTVMFKVAGGEGGGLLVIC